MCEEKKIWIKTIIFDYKKKKTETRFSGFFEVCSLKKKSWKKIMDKNSG